MGRKLKVYRTPIGFHDAYVAATSQKAALEAWGADVDLFARGAAEIVTDDALTKEPLEKPGSIVRRLRGSDDEQQAALSDRPSRHKALKVEANTKRAKPEPPPSRAKLTVAEASLEALAAKQVAQRDKLRAQELALQQQRRKLDTTQECEIAKCEAAIRRERQRYDAAVSKWRS